MAAYNDQIRRLLLRKVMKLSSRLADQYVPLLDGVGAGCGQLCQFSFCLLYLLFLYTTQIHRHIAAVGKRNVLTADMVKPGAVVLDVGMNRNDEGKLCGDVDFDGVKEVAGWITPVPGGVGPMTITMLMVNTLESAERSLA